jgi:outer membrane protein, adhesin transport system
MIKNNLLCKATSVMTPQKIFTTKRIINVLSLLSLVTIGSFAYAEEPFSLEKLVEKTVTSNPEVQARYHAFKAAEQEQGVAKGGFFPNVNFVATARTQETLIPNVNNTQTPNTQTQLVLRQMLFDGFATSSEVKRLGHNTQARYYELQGAMQNTALELIKAYLDVQRYTKLVSYAKDNYAAHKQLYDRIEDRVNAGVGRRVDLEQANGRLALAEANLLTEATNLHDVTARYQKIADELPPEALPDVEFYKSGVAPSVAEALQAAYQKNPDLLAAIENIVATQQEVEGKRAKYYPRVDLQATKNISTSTNGENSTLAADVLQLTATINLFNGLSDKSTIDQTVQKLNSSADLRDKACVDTRQTITVAYNDINQLKEELSYRDQHQLAIDKAREAYRKQFDIGQRTLLDLLDTENEYFQARRNYTITEYDYYTAYARAYASEGDLLTKLGVVRADLPEVGQQAYLDNYKVCQVAVVDAMVVDKAQVVAEAKAAPIVVADAVAEAPVVTPYTELNSAVSGWADAWRRKDVNTYLSYYSENFQPEKLANKKVWEAQRRKRLAAPETISLSLENVQTVINGDKATASFLQNYSSNTYQDKVNKTLRFSRENNKWQITGEETANGSTPVLKPTVAKKTAAAEPTLLF